MNSKEVDITEPRTTEEYLAKLKEFETAIQTESTNFNSATDWDQEEAARKKRLSLIDDKNFYVEIYGNYNFTNQKPLTLDDVDTAIDDLTKKIGESKDDDDREFLTAQKEQLISTRGTLLKINSVRSPKITEASYTARNQRPKMNELKKSRLKTISIIMSILVAISAIGLAANKISNNFRENIKVTETTKPGEATTLSAYEEKNLLSNPEFQMNVLGVLSSTLDSNVREELDSKIKDIVAEENPNSTFTAEELANYNYSFEMATSENGFDVNNQNDSPYIIWLQFENTSANGNTPCSPRFLIPSEKAQDLYVAYLNLEFLLQGYDYITEFGYSDEGITATSNAKTRATSDSIKILAELSEKYGIKISSIGGQDFSKLITAADTFLAEQKAAEKNDEGR